MDKILESIELSISFLNRFDFFSLIQVNHAFKKRFSHSEDVISIIRYNCVPRSFIPHFWELVLCTYRDDVLNVINKDDYCFEFYDDDTSDIVPHYHGNRLMKDEYIDGEISRDVCRTFPNHLLFRHKELGGQSILESVLRKVSENYFGLGYCQGMNYVVGSIMIALIDPELNGYYSDNDTDELQKRIQYMDRDDIKKQMYDITAVLIDRLQMMRLWGYGFPDIPLYVFILRHYLQQIAPSLLQHFDEVGFELSILITKWFIPLFSNIIPFHLLFRIWDFIFIKGIPGLFRITVSLLVFFADDLLSCDLIQISDFFHYIGIKRLVKEKEIQLWFNVVSDLHTINKESYSVLVSEFNTRCTITMSLDAINKRDQLTSDINVLLKRIKDIHEEESLMRNDLRNNMTDLKRYEAEVKELRLQRQDFRDEYELLLSMDDQEIHNSHLSEQSERGKELRSISAHLTQIQNQLQDIEDGLTVIRRLIDEGIENLEDINTKRLSLRIQLSQLIKEKSLLLINTIIQ